MVIYEPLENVLGLTLGLLDKYCASFVLRNCSQHLPKSPCLREYGSALIGIVNDKTLSQVDAIKGSSCRQLSPTAAAAATQAFWEKAT